MSAPPCPDPHWKQYRGDPAIRGGLFEQSRVHSAMDDQFNETFAAVENLMQQPRHTLYRPLPLSCAAIDELLHAIPWYAYPQIAYPADAVIEP